MSSAGRELAETLAGQSCNPVNTFNLLAHGLGIYDLGDRLGFDGHITAQAHQAVEHSLAISRLSLVTAFICRNSVRPPHEVGTWLDHPHHQLWWADEKERPLLTTWRAAQGNFADVQRVVGVARNDKVIVDNFKTQRDLNSLLRNQAS